MQRRRFLMSSGGLLAGTALGLSSPARAKGLPERSVLYRHVFRNAMLIVISGFPGAFIGASLPCARARRLRSYGSRLAARAWWWFAARA